FYRILFFYFLSVLLFGMLVPYSAFHGRNTAPFPTRPSLPPRLLVHAGRNSQTARNSPSPTKPPPPLRLPPLSSLLNSPVSKPSLESSTGVYFSSSSPPRTPTSTSPAAHSTVSPVRATRHAYSNAPTHVACPSTPWDSQ